MPAARHSALYKHIRSLPAAPITVTSGHQAKNAFPFLPPQGSKTDGGGELMGKVEVRNQTLRLAWYPYFQPISLHPNSGMAP